MLKCANQIYYMKNKSVQSAAPHIHFVCDKLQHALVKSIQTRLLQMLKSKEKLNIIHETKTFMLHLQVRHVTKKQADSGRHGSVARFITVRIVCSYLKTHCNVLLYNLQTLMTCMCIVKGKHLTLSCNGNYMKRSHVLQYACTFSL